MHISAVSASATAPVDEPLTEVLPNPILIRSHRRLSRRASSPLETLTNSASTLFGLRGALTFTFHRARFGGRGNKNVLPSSSLQLPPRLSPLHLLNIDLLQVPQDSVVQGFKEELVPSIRISLRYWALFSARNRSVDTARSLEEPNAVINSSVRVTFPTSCAPDLANTEFHSFRKASFRLSPIH